MKEIQVVGAAIINQNKILAVQRSEKMSTPLKWEFVGGKVEEEETYEQALKREVLEELGIVVSVGEHIAVGSSMVNGNKIILHVYMAQWDEGEISLREHAQFKWIEPDKIMELDWAEADIPACLMLRID